MGRLLLVFFLGASLGAVASFIATREATSHPSKAEETTTRTEKQSASSSTGIDDRPLPKDVSTGHSPRSDCPPPDEPTESACIALFTKKSAIEQAKRDSEPTDPTWSYAMTQRLEKFIANQKESEQLQFTKIDCRSTFCEVEAIGMDAKSVLAFQRVMDEASKDSGLQASAHSADSDGTRSIMRHRLVRP